jgi:hypothetical protein
MREFTEALCTLPLTPTHGCLPQASPMKPPFTMKPWCPLPLLLCSAQGAHGSV